MPRENFAAGGWSRVNVGTFTSSNNNLVQEAVNAVNTQYNPAQKGYTFDKVVSVDQQVIEN